MPNPNPTHPDVPEEVVEARWFKQRHTDDCLWACIASVLGFDPLSQGQWEEPLSRPTRWAWDPVLKSHGYSISVVPPAAVKDSGSLWILLVTSLHEPTDGHAVVMRGRELAWDPGRRTPRYDQDRIDAELRAATGAGAGRSALLLLPLDPAAAPRHRGQPLMPDHRPDVPEEIDWRTLGELFADPAAEGKRYFAEEQLPAIRCQERERAERAEEALRMIRAEDRHNLPARLKVIHDIARAALDAANGEGE